MSFVHKYCCFSVSPHFLWQLLTTPRLGFGRRVNVAGTVARPKEIVASTEMESAGMSW